MENERIIDRFDKYMTFKHLNDNIVTTECGLGIGTIGKAKSGRNDLGKRTIDKLLAKYQDLSKVWLLTGEGEMLISDGKKHVDEHTPDQVTKLIDELSAQRRMTEKALEQNDRLITLLEKEAERTEVIVAQKRV